MTVCAGIRRKLGCAIICTQDLFHGNRIPYAADSGNYGAILNSSKKPRLFRAQKRRAAGNCEHGVGNIYPFDVSIRFVPSTVIRNSVIV